MDSNKFERLINRIYKTADGELDCGQVRELVAAYVDALVDRTPTESHFRDIRLHLDQCSDCEDLYAGLLRVAELESRDESPTSAELMAALTPEAKSKSEDASLCVQRRSSSIPKTSTKMPVARGDEAREPLRLTLTVAT